MYSEMIETSRGPERHVKGSFAVALSIVFVVASFVLMGIVVWLSISKNGHPFSMLSGLILCFVAGILFWKFCPSIIANEIKFSIAVLVGTLMMLLTSGLVWPATSFAIIEKPNENIVIAKDNFSFQRPFTKIDYWSGFIPVAYFSLPLDDTDSIQLRVSALLERDATLPRVSQLLKEFGTRKKWNEAVEAVIERLTRDHLGKNIVLTTNFPIEIEFYPSAEHVEIIKRFGYKFQGTITIRRTKPR